MPDNGLYEAKLAGASRERQAIARAFYDLDIRHREALWLTEVEGGSLEEVAELMGERPGQIVAARVSSQREFVSNVISSLGLSRTKGSEALAELPLPHSDGLTGEDHPGRSLVARTLLWGVVGVSPQQWDDEDVREEFGDLDAVFKIPPKDSRATPSAPLAVAPSAPKPSTSEPKPSAPAAVFPAVPAATDAAPPAPKPIFTPLPKPPAAAVPAAAAVMGVAADGDLDVEPTPQPDDAPWDDIPPLDEPPRAPESPSPSAITPIPDVPQVPSGSGLWTGSTGELRPLSEIPSFADLLERAPLAADRAPIEEPVAPPPVQVTPKPVVFTPLAPKPAVEAPRPIVEAPQPDSVIPVQVIADHRGGDPGSAGSVAAAGAALAAAVEALHRSTASTVSSGTKPPTGAGSSADTGFGSGSGFGAGTDFGSSVDREPELFDDDAHPDRSESAAAGLTLAASVAAALRANMAAERAAAEAAASGESQFEDESSSGAFGSGGASTYEAASTYAAASAYGATGDTGSFSTSTGPSLHRSFPGAPDTPSDGGSRASSRGPGSGPYFSSKAIAEGDLEDAPDDDELTDEEDEKKKGRGLWWWLRIAIAIILIIIVALLLRQCFTTGDVTTPPSSTTPTVSLTPSNTPSSTATPTFSDTAEPSETPSEEPSASETPSETPSDTPSATQTTKAPVPAPTKKPSTNPAPPPLPQYESVAVKSIDAGPYNVCSPQLSGTATPGDILTIVGLGSDTKQVSVAGDGTWSSGRVPGFIPGTRSVSIVGLNSPRADVVVTQVGPPSASTAGSTIREVVVTATGVPGATADITLDTQPKGSVTFGATGQATVTYAGPFNNGPHTLTIRYNGGSCLGPITRVSFSL